MGKVLFICAGNVARSQMAEAFYNTLTQTTDAISAGILPHTPEKYKHPIKEVIEIMREENVDISTKYVKLVSQEMVKSSDKVYVLCDKDGLPEFVLQNPNVTYWEIADPFGTTIENFRHVRDTIREKVKSLIQ